MKTMIPAGYAASGMSMRDYLTAGADGPMMGWTLQPVLLMVLILSVIHLIIARIHLCLTSEATLI